MRLVLESGWGLGDTVYGGRQERGDEWVSSWTDLSLFQSQATCKIGNQCERSITILFPVPSSQATIQPGSLCSVVAVFFF